MVRLIGIAFFGLVLGCSGSDSDSDSEPMPQNHHHGSLEGVTTGGDSDNLNLSDEKHFLLSAVWEPSDLRAGINTDHVAHVNFYLPDGSKAESVEIKSFYVHMPMMGHGTNTKNQATVATAQPHHWRIEGVSFSMAGEAGEWKVTVTAVVNGKEDQVTLDLPAVKERP